jgi:WD40 repeat protein
LNRVVFGEECRKMWGGINRAGVLPLTAPWTSLRRLTTAAIRATARFQGALNVPLRWPTITTRRLMLLVAVVALLIWGVREVPPIIDRMNEYEHYAFGHSVSAKDFRDRQHERLAQASLLRAALDQWRRDEGTSDPLTDRYFAVRWEVATEDAQYFGDMADFHAGLERKFRRASWFPWSGVPLGPTPPREPPAPRPLTTRPGEIIVATEGGDAVAFAPAGAGLAVACRDHTIRLLEPLSRKVLATFPLSDDLVHSLVFSPDGGTLIAAGGNRQGSFSVRRWEVATHRALPPISLIDRSSVEPEPSIYPTDVACSPDGGMIAVGGGGQLSQVKRVSTMVGGFMAKPPPPFYVVRVLNTRTGALIWEYKGPGDWVDSVDFSANGKTLACANGVVRLLDARTGTLKTTLKPVKGYVSAAAFSRDGRILAGAGSNTVVQVGVAGEGRITIWDVETGTILHTLDGPTGRAQQVAFSPDGSTVVAAGTGPMKERRDTFSGVRMSDQVSEVQLWDVATGRKIWCVEGETGAAYSMSMSPDGKLLAFCDSDFVYLIDVPTGKLKKILMETVWKVQVREQPTKKQ